MSIVAKTPEQFQFMLERGMCPITDNQDILIDFGFIRAYPQVSKGYEATIWERVLDGGFNEYGYRRNRVQRAFLEKSKGDKRGK